MKRHQEIESGRESSEEMKKLPVMVRDRERSQVASEKEEREKHADARGKRPRCGEREKRAREYERQDHI